MERPSEHIYGHMYLNAERGCDFGPLSFPRHVTVDTCQLVSCGAEFDLTLGISLATENPSSTVNNIVLRTRHALFRSHSIQLRAAL